MGHATAPCYGCNAPILSSDVERRRVVIVLKRPYCRTCAEQITTRRTGQKSRTYVVVAALLILCLLAAVSWALSIRS